MESVNSSTDINPTPDERDWRTGDLCKQCQDVDLHKVFVAPIMRKTWIDKSEIFVLRISEGSPCPLCKFYAGVLPADCRLQPGENVEISLQRWESGPDYIYMDFWLQSKNFLANSKSRKMKIVPIEEMEVGRSRYLDIQTRSIDYGVLRNWIAHCETSHSQLCREPRLDSLEASKLRLIDCRTRTVTVLRHRHRYVALSYVWGPPQQERSHSNPATALRNLNGKTIQVSNVIGDAVTVTLKLGLQYLWVDQVCINQDDAEDKRQQLHCMDSIYNQAFLTIVAAAGDRGSYGLPGVGTRPRTTRPKIRLNGTTWTAYAAFPHDAVYRSAWIFRGWTFQESFFTRRFLMFTDEQVIFECGSMLQMEDRVQDLDAPEIAWGINSPRNFIERCDSKAHPLSLMSLIGTFTSRKLTNEEDILEAMDGLFSFYSHLEPPVENFWGLPVRWSGYSMGNEVLDAYRAGDSKFKHDDVAGAILLGLQWSPSNEKRPVTRREGFPSWSWSGWKTTANGMDIPSQYGETPSTLEIPMHVVTTNNELVAVNEVFARSLASGKSYEMLGYTQILQIEAQVLEIPFVKWEDYERRNPYDDTLQVSPMYTAFSRMHGEPVSFAVVQNVGSEIGALVWPLFLTCTAADTEDICKDPTIKTIECVVIDHKHGLLVQTRDGISCRVGLIYFESEFLKDGGMRSFGWWNEKKWEWSREVNKRDLRDYFSSSIKTIRLG